MPAAVPSRAEIPVEFTWDVASVYASREAWEYDIAQLEVDLNRVVQFEGRLAEGPETLAQWFDAVEALLRRMGRIYIYASMVYDVDTADGDAKEQLDRAMSLWARVQSAMAFGEPELLAIGFPTLRSWLRKTPALGIYDHYLDELERRQEHVRSAEIEEVLGLAGDAFHTASSTHRILTDTDLRFRPARTAESEDIELVQGNLSVLLRSSDREVRRTSWENYADAHLAFRHGMANCLAAAVKQHVFEARVRRYSSSLEASLAPNHIPLDVFHNLIDSFRRHLPTWHRYWSVLRRALGYDRLRVYDIKAPLATNPPLIPYAQAVDLIAQGMAPLGEEYVDVLRRGATAERWVDIYPNLGKTSGAYSNGWPGTHPFILMGYDDDIFSLSTLAHELGHSLHSFYSWRAQPLIYADYSLFSAEVASNVNQALVRSHLFAARPDPDFQIALLEEAMNNFHRYFFIMPTLARFELEIHERAERGDALSADIFNEIMLELFREGYGDEVEIDPDRIGITWAEFSGHLYMNFYVYQYATGIAAAQALARRVVDGGPEAAEAYLSFLKAGSSLYPLDALRLAGVDMTRSEPVEAAFAAMAGMIDRLDELIAARAEKVASGRT